MKSFLYSVFILIITFKSFSFYRRDMYVFKYVVKSLKIAMHVFMPYLIWLNIKTMLPIPYNNYFSKYGFQENNNNNIYKIL